MGRHGPKLLWLTVAMLIAAGAGIGWAGERAPTVTEMALEPVWGSVYKLSAKVRAGRGTVTAAQYRVGTQTGPLFAADGLLDSPVERVETYVDFTRSTGPVEVRARAGGVWSDWQPVDGSAPGSGPWAPCELFADVPGDEGPREWYRGPVVIDCFPLLMEEEAERVDFALLSDAQWLGVEDAYAIIEEEGVHWVQVRAVRADGTVSRPHTFPVKIDATPPEIQMEPLPELVGHADKITLRFEAEDDRSGLDLLVAEIDGEMEVLPGRTLEAWRLPAGLHEVTIRAVDRAGNETVSESVPLMVITDPGELAALVQLFAARGKLDSFFGFKAELLGHLQATEEALAQGNLLAAQEHLDRFAIRVEEGMESGLIFEDAAEVLLADVAWLFAWAEENLDL